VRFAALTLLPHSSGSRRAKACLAALREFTPDIILTDHSLPAFGAADALEIAQQNSPGTPSSS